MLKGLLLYSLTLVLISLSNFAHAQSNVIFTNFSPQDFEDVNEDLTSAFTHTTHNGAASLGKIFGIEVGLVLGLVEANNLERVSQSTSSSSEGIPYLPSAGISGAIGLPFGLGAEVNLIPEIDEIEDAKFENFSIAARWSITDMFPLKGGFSKLKLALRASHGNSETTYATTGNEALLGNYTASADFKTETTEFTFLVGYDLSWFEPYLSVGSVKSNGDLFAETVSDLQGTDTANYAAEFNGTRVVLGLAFKLPILRLGFEYSQIADAPRLTTKIAFKL